MREERAGKCDEPIAECHSDVGRVPRLNTLRTRHAPVDAGRPHCEPVFGGEETGDQQDCGDCKDARNDRLHIKHRESKALEARQNRLLGDDGDVRPTHDAQIDRVERDHRQDAGQQVQDAEADVQKCGHQPSEASAYDCRTRGRIRVPAAHDERCAEGCAEREAAVDGQIGKVEDPER